VPKEQAQLADDPAVTPNALIRLDSYVAFKADADSPTYVPFHSRSSAVANAKIPCSQSPFVLSSCRMLIVSALAVVGTYAPTRAAPAVEAKAAVFKAVKAEGDKENTAQPAAAPVAAIGAAAAVEPPPATAPTNPTASPQYASAGLQVLSGATWTLIQLDQLFCYRHCCCIRASTAAKAAVSPSSPTADVSPISDLNPYRIRYGAFTYASIGSAES